MASFDYVGELKVSKSDAGREFLKQLDEKISDYIYGAVEYQDDYVVISIHELKDPEKNWRLSGLPASLTARSSFEMFS